MIDPFTALAAVKSAVSAGKELVNVTKQIGEFFDGVDDLRAAHEKKKNSLFRTIGIWGAHPVKSTAASARSGWYSPLSRTSSPPSDES